MLFWLTAHHLLLNILMSATFSAHFGPSSQSKRLLDHHLIGLSLHLTGLLTICFFLPLKHLIPSNNGCQCSHWVKITSNCKFEDWTFKTLNHCPAQLCQCGVLKYPGRGKFAPSSTGNICCSWKQSVTFLKVGWKFRPEHPSNIQHHWLPPNWHRPLSHKPLLLPVPLPPSTRTFSISSPSLASHPQTLERDSETEERVVGWLELG